MTQPQRAGMESRDRATRQAARRERRAAVTDPDVVMAAAAALLGARPWTVSDMRRRLATLGYPTALVEVTVVRLVELGYLDDARYAAAWIASRDRSRPRGSTALRRELGRKGIEPAVIDRALVDRDDAPGDATDPEGIDPDGSADLAAAARLLERRHSALMRESDLRKRRHKAYALLARNGFDPDVCARLAATVDS
jgi:regulatory protein